MLQIISGKVPLKCSINFISNLHHTVYSLSEASQVFNNAKKLRCLSKYVYAVFIVLSVFWGLLFIVFNQPLKLEN